MRRIFIFAIVVVLVLSVVGPMGSAIAQESESDDDQDELESDEIDGNETDALEQASIIEDRNETVQFGEIGELAGWGFDDGTVQVAISAERPLDIVIVDSIAGVGEEGAVQPPTHEVSIDEGIHVVTMPVESLNGGHSVTVNVGGAQVRLSSEMVESEPDDPLSYFGGLSGLFWGIGMTTGLAATAAGYVVYREDSGVIKA